MRARVLRAVIAAGLAALAVACGGGNGGGGDTLVFGRNKDAVHLDPAIAPDGMPPGV